MTVVTLNKKLVSKYSKHLNSERGYYVFGVIGTVHMLTLADMVVQRAACGSFRKSGPGYLHRATITRHELRTRTIPMSPFKRLQALIHSEDT
jgi:hypothetical protein